MDEADGEGLLVELEVELPLLLSERCWARSSGETKSRDTATRLEGRIGHLLPDGETPAQLDAAGLNSGCT